MLQHKVVIIGSGNVATHLAKAFRGSVMISSRSLADVPADADIYILAVSDDAIGNVAAAMPDVNGLVVHTSGSVPMQVLACKSRKIGVLYPLQTFSKGVEMNYSKIPFFIETEDEDDCRLLKELCRSIGCNAYYADSAGRLRLHIAAAFCCNFVNYLIGIADRILKDEPYGLDVMLPLIRQTVEKLDSVSPSDAQTGPAARKDTGTLRRHMEALAEYPDYLRLYELLTDGIMKDLPR